jgi:hypothetical protein
MENNQAIFESLFKRNFSDEGNHHFLNEITAAHPYFSPAQFFLLQQTAGTSAYEKQAAKTNILFNNPYWLNFQLQQTANLPTGQAGGKPQVESEYTTMITEDPAMHREPLIQSEKVEAVYVEEPKTEPLRTKPFIQPETEKAVYVEEQKNEALKTGLNILAEKNVMDEMPLFEPMHMVDYFASQGIKLNEEAQPADKLGKQLKSFTEWLKTMKKVHVDRTEESAGPADNSIQSLAEKSNKEDEVLTVSMADVFAKQGKVDKAIEVLEKLSLLNPAKSAYFAAKIEHLKGL